MRPVALFLALFLALLPGPAPAETVPEPPTYRMEEYRAPVPASLEGVTVVSAEAAHALWKTGRVAFIDVLPRPPKPADLPEGTVWHEQPRRSVPGAIWLANVGYGELADVMHDHFRAGLTKMTGGDLTAPVLFFCLAECWMSWNAAKRAQAEYGYTRVFWYPDGTDGWVAAGYPTELLEPEPGGK